MTEEKPAQRDQRNHDEAESLRIQAIRFRRLAQNTYDAKTADALNEEAQKLEDQAKALAEIEAKKGEEEGQGPTNRT